MFECELPFDHKTLHLELEDKSFAGVMEGHQNEFKTTKSQEELVEESLANPYGSPSLEELCAGKKDIVIISSDHTRPVPSRVTMPILLHHIHSAAPEARVRILVATGMHRPSTHEELVNKYGEEIVANEEIVMHVATDDSMMKKIGTLPSGGECIIKDVYKRQSENPECFDPKKPGREGMAEITDIVKIRMENLCSVGRA